jgi:hypothetical protein
VWWEFQVCVGAHCLFVCLFGQVHHEYMERSKASKKGLSVVFFSKKRSFFI